jgi:hypothetical protein
MEELVEEFPNEMLAQLSAGILLQEGIHSVVKPRMGGYGMWGHDSFIPHGLYVMPDRAKEAKALLDPRPEAGEEEPR